MKHISNMCLYDFYIYIYIKHIINDTIMKYLKKNQIYMKTFIEKNHGQKRKFRYEYERITKYGEIENKP